MNGYRPGRDGPSRVLAGCRIIARALRACQLPVPTPQPPLRLASSSRTKGLVWRSCPIRVSSM